MPAVDFDRLKALAVRLTGEDVLELEQGKARYVSHFGVALPEDLNHLEATFPGWRKRLERPPEGKMPAVRKEPPQETPPAKVIPLLWKKDERGIPRPILRSALFAVIKKGQRQALERVEIASLPGIKILFTGIQLDQADLDVYLHCLHLARESGSWEPIRISEVAFLKSLGRSIGKANVAWLRRSLARLCAAVLEVQVTLEDGATVGYMGAMIQDCHYAKPSEEKTRRCRIQLNPKLASLFNGGLWVALDWETRKALKGHPLAQWLHAFYSTHDAPYPYKVATLMKLCGGQNTCIRDFRRKLREAAKRLAGETGWKVWIDENDCLRVEKTSPKQ